MIIMPVENTVVFSFFCIIDSKPRSSKILLILKLGPFAEAQRRVSTGRRKLRSMRLVELILNGYYEVLGTLVLGLVDLFFSINEICFL